MVFGVTPLHKAAKVTNKLLPLDSVTVRSQNTVVLYCQSRYRHWLGTVKVDTVVP